jgi:hypothetical protein
VTGQRGEPQSADIRRVWSAVGARVGHNHRAGPSAWEGPAPSFVDLMALAFPEAVGPLVVLRAATSCDGSVLGSSIARFGGCALTS